MSSVSYNRIGADLRHYWTVIPRLTIAAHAYLQYTPAKGETPFWSMPRLGGEESLLYDQDTLRGFGVGRFTDNNLSVRTSSSARASMKPISSGPMASPKSRRSRHRPRLQCAVSDPVAGLHSVGGVGFRAIAEPFVVGYVDVGYGGMAPPSSRASIIPSRKRLSRGNYPRPTDRQDFVAPKRDGNGVAKWLPDGVSGRVRSGRLRFGNLRVGHATIHRTDRSAFFVVEEADTFGAFCRARCSKCPRRSRR